MNEGRPGNGMGTHANSHAAQPVRLVPTSGAVPTAGPGVRATPSAAAAVTQIAPAAHTMPHAPPPPPLPKRPMAEEPLELEGEEEQPATPTAEPHKSKIHGITSAASLAQHAYKRPTHYNKTGAVRMRTFHCRLSEQGVEYLDQLINDWLESHPDIEVKFVTSTIGMWDGKLKEPTLILNVWY
jgi:hypothetical protein